MWRPRRGFWPNWSVPGRKLLITDGVFSMDGDIGPLPGLVEAAEQHGAIMMVDDAHSSGVLGRNGRGTIDHFGLDGRVHIQVGTLSKAIGVLGGYVCGSRDLIEFLYHRARPFLFSTSHPPAVAAACLAAFDVLEQEPERIEQLWDNTRYFKAGLKSAGFNTGISETPITPVIVGDAALAHQLSRELFEEGVLATGIGFPTVAKGKARVRTIVASTHTKAELDPALEAFGGLQGSVCVFFVWGGAVRKTPVERSVYPVRDPMCASRVRGYIHTYGTPKSK